LVPVAYDSDDSPANTYFIRDVAGVVAAPAINITSRNISAKTGSPEYKALYSPNPYSLTPNSFLSYIKARKQHKVITNPDLSEIASSGIYIYQSVSPLDIDVSNSPVFNGKNVVLISSGTINIDGDFNTTGSVAIVAGQINFGNTVTQAKGIFIGNNIDSGTASFGLKIIGNLVAQTTFTKSRTQPNLNMPAIFIVFDGQKYIDLLPYLSTAYYDWRQIQ